jgi:hypothetical protein
MAWEREQPFPFHRGAVLAHTDEPLRDLQTPRKCCSPFPPCRSTERPPFDGLKGNGNECRPEIESGPSHRTTPCGPTPQPHASPGRLRHQRGRLHHLLLQPLQRCMWLPMTKGSAEVLHGGLLLFTHHSPRMIAGGGRGGPTYGRRRPALQGRGCGTGRGASMTQPRWCSPWSATWAVLRLGAAQLVHESPSPLPRCRGRGRQATPQFDPQRHEEQSPAV